MRIDFYIHNDNSSENKLDRILAALGLITARETAIMADLRDLNTAADAALAAIEDESSKDDAIIKLVTANTQQIVQLRADLAAAIAAGDPAAVQAVLDKLTTAQSNALANSARVLAAVNANTPA